MEPDILGELLLLALLIIVDAFFAATETALVSSRRSRLRQLRNGGVRWAGLVEKLAEDSRPLLTTVYLSNVLVRFTIAASAVLFLVPPVSEWFGRVPSIASVATSLAVVLVVSVLALVVLVFGELLPKSLALRNPEGVALRHFRVGRHTGS